MICYKSVSRTFVLLLLAFLVCCGVAQARTSLDGEVKIHNARFSQISIHIDETFVGRLKPKQTRVFKHVPNGIRLVRIIDSNQKDLVRKVAVPVASRAHMDIKAIGGKAIFRTSSVGRLRVSIDGKFAGTVQAGRKLLSKTLSNGTHTMSAVPTSGVFRSRKPIKKTFVIANGKVTDVELEAWFAAVTVHNPDSDRVRLYVDGKRTRRIAGGSSVTVTDVEPGVRHLSLKRRGRVIAQTRMDIRHGEQAKWSPTIHRTGSLLVTNRVKGPIWIKIDGQLQAGLQIEAGESQYIRSLNTGTRQVTIISRRTGEQVHRVRIRAGETARLVAFSDSSRRRVSSRSDEGESENPFIKIVSNTRR